MTKEFWTGVDEYLVGKLVPDASELDWILETNADADLPKYDVSPLQGKLLEILVRMCKAKQVLELGTLGGYSTVWMARTLPLDGRLVTLESDKKHADVAKANFVKANVDHKVELRLGPALDNLRQLEKEKAKFDFVFIDADKPNNPYYFEWTLKLTHSGSFIIFDNAIRNGEVADEESKDENVLGFRRLNDLILASDKVHATGLQTVGQKGHDGFTILLVK